jgi:hypothetical protein
MSRTNCPVSRAQFQTTATALDVKVGDQALAALPREFSTGSFGYQGNGKVILMIDGKPALCQVGINVTVIGSKLAG